jgi:type II secretory pathway pseudopilin PulG
VIFIIMILAGLAAPVAGRGIMQSRMNSAAAQAVTALKAARNRAITKGRVHCAVFDNSVGQSKIVTWDIIDEGLGVPSSLPTLPAAGWERAGGAQLEKGATFGALPQAFIVFLPDGSAWGPGMQAVREFKVTPDAEHDVPGTLDERRIVVGSLSGSVSIMRQP